MKLYIINLCKFHPASPLKPRFVWFLYYPMWGFCYKPLPDNDKTSPTHHTPCDCRDWDLRVLLCLKYLLAIFLYFRFIEVHKYRTHYNTVILNLISSSCYLFWLWNCSVLLSTCCVDCIYAISKQSCLTRIY